MRISVFYVKLLLNHLLLVNYGHSELHMKLRWLEYHCALTFARNIYVFT
jgi:hypothetical protein